MAKRKRLHPQSQDAQAKREEEVRKRRRQKEIEELRNMSLFGKSKSPKTRKPKKEQKEPSSTVLASKNYKRSSVDHIESFRPGLVPQPASPVRYEGEMEEREREAQKEIERKKMRVAPMYNKGGYQYVTDETDPSDLGRKK